MVWSADMAHVALLGKHGESEFIFDIMPVTKRGQQNMYDSNFQ